MQELNNKLESLPYEKNFFTNENISITKNEESTFYKYGTVVKVTFSIYLGYHLPVSTFVARYEDGVLTGETLTTYTPITEEEIIKKVCAIQI